jgi:hypothetical protein
MLCYENVVSRFVLSVRYVQAMFLYRTSELRVSGSVARSVAVVAAAVCEGGTLTYTPSWPSLSELDQNHCALSTEQPGLGTLQSLKLVSVSCGFITVCQQYRTLSSCYLRDKEKWTPVAFPARDAERSSLVHTNLVGSLAFIRNSCPVSSLRSQVILSQQNYVATVTIPETSALPFEVIFCTQDFSFPEEFLIVYPYLITN